MTWNEGMKELCSFKMWRLQYYKMGKTLRKPTQKKKVKKIKQNLEEDDDIDNHPSSSRTR